MNNKKRVVIKMLETVTVIYVFFLSFAPLKQDKLPEVR